MNMRYRAIVQPLPRWRRVIKGSGRGGKMKPERKRSIATRVVHAGEQRGAEIRPTSTPMYNASSFMAPSVAEIDAILGGDVPGYVYTRDGNPTVAAFERAIADLEGAEGAVAFGSGMAAIHAALLAVGI